MTEITSLCVAKCKVKFASLLHIPNLTARKFLVTFACPSVGTKVLLAMIFPPSSTLGNYYQLLSPVHLKLIPSIIRPLRNVSKVYIECKIKLSYDAHNYSCLLLSVVWMILKKGRLHAMCTYDRLKIWGYQYRELVQYTWLHTSSYLTVGVLFAKYTWVNLICNEMVNESSTSIYILILWFYELFQELIP